jgi:predicted GIY-YIG superfamily endonuclease
MSFIYLIHNEDSGFYKIGVSKNPYNRIKQLQTGSNSKLQLKQLYEAKEYAYRVESVLHRSYNLNERFNEWFYLDKQQVENFLINCEKIKQNLKYIDNNNSSSNLNI